MEEPLAELAGYSRGGSQVPDTDLVRLTAAARTAGHRWDAIAAACDNGPGQDIPGVIRQQYWISPAVGPGPLFSATQRAARNLAGHEAGCYRPLTWPCPGCGHQVTDLAPGGRPVHAELGHAAGCTRLARDQGADDALRREWLPRLILYSDDPIGSLQRHWLAGPITDDCPRCGWHGYFHHHLATIDGNWAYTLCDDCYADLNPAITVTVTFFSARSAGSSEPFAVIRRRTRSDYPYPDRGQMMTWRLRWEHTAMLVEEAHGGADADIAEITGPRPSRSRPGWQPGTGRLRRSGCPGWPAPIRGNSAQHVPEPRETPGRDREVREWARPTESRIRAQFAPLSRSRSVTPDSFVISSNNYRSPIRDA